MSMSRFTLVAAWCLVFALTLCAPAGAQNFRRGVIYAPIYTQAIIDHRGRSLDLAATVYVRNLSRQHALTVDAVTLVDGKGQIGTQCIKGKQRLDPLATLRLLPPACPAGTGEPSILIHWSASQPVPPPLVEVLMMGTAGQQGISLTSKGVALEQGP